MGTEQLDQRVNSLEKAQVRIETNLEQQDKRLDKLDKDFVEMNTTLKGILHSLNQVKWVATGAILMATAQQLGLLEALKRVFL
jgi:septal ring factor EnvC (AmiA/AmiB activator)